MKKTYCDRCGVEIEGEELRPRYNLYDYDKGRMLDLCTTCHGELELYAQPEDD